MAGLSASTSNETSLLTETDHDLIGRLGSLFHNNQLTGYLSTQVIVSCNDYSIPGRTSTAGIESSIHATKDLAARAFTRLKYRSENQAIVFYGDSGSGKTTLRSHLLSSLLAHSSSSESLKLSHAAFIFDSLTTTKTSLTPTASKSGLFYELQYATSMGEPALIGGKLLDHRLDRSRVTKSSAAECNYQIFYYLICGLSDSERSFLEFPAVPTSGTATGKEHAMAKNWRYLEHPASMAMSFDVATDNFDKFKQALGKVGFSPGIVANICLLLAAILYLGELEFGRAHASAALPNQSGREGGEDVIVVRNQEVLNFVAPILGLTPKALQTSLSYKSKMLGSERVTVLLDHKGARENANELARTLYSLLVAYVMEQVNTSLCATEGTFSNTISIVDFPGHAPSLSTESIVDLLLTNTANECLYNFCVKTYYDDLQNLLTREDIAVPATAYLDNMHAVDVLKNGKCLLSILDDNTRNSHTDMMFLDGLKSFYDKKHATLPEEQKAQKALSVDLSSEVIPGSNFSTVNKNAKFTVHHYNGPVDYYVTGLVEANGELISTDLANLITTSSSNFVKDLFSQEALNAVPHKGDSNTIMRASVSSKPTRQPSLLHQRKSPRLGEQSEKDTNRSRTKTKNQIQGAAGQYLSALDNIWASLSAPETNSYFYFCLNSNDRKEFHQFDPKLIRTQALNYGLLDLRMRLKVANLNILVPYDKFLKQYPAVAGGGNAQRHLAESIIAENRWPPSEARVGFTGVILSERLWFEWAGVSIQALSAAKPVVERGYGINEAGDDYKTGLLTASKVSSPAMEDKNSYLMETRSDAGYSALNGDMFRNMDDPEKMAEKVEEAKMEEIETQTVSASRKRWLFMVWMLTFYLPDFIVKRCSKKFKTDDIRTAWREKVAINILIWLSCGLVVFFMVGFPALICPTQHVYSAAELTSHDGKDGHDAFVSIRGIVYNLGDFAPVHYPRIVSQTALLKYAGMDITNLFPIQVSALCNGVDGRIDPAVQLDYKDRNYTGTPTAVSRVDRNAKYHDFRWATNDSRPDWWWEQQIYLKANYMKGRVGYPPKYLKQLGDKGSAIAILYDRVYDMSYYVPGGRSPQYPAGYDIPTTRPNSDFMDDNLISLFRQRAGTDITKYWEALRMEAGLRTRMLTCLNNLFYVGDVDTRGSTKCLFAKYLLLAISIFLVSVIGFKFLAALQFGRKNEPENLNKFVICTVPAYTEDEESLRRAIDSAARMRYDDKRKLLVVICDGMIIGQGNDRPTPQIVLDILGVSTDVEPDALSFQSLGEGQKQHNLGRIYTGLYEVQGHIVPFMVVVKIGKPTEVSRPGNRGKRDSQMVLMRFLNRVHYNLPMTPMELEMYHQIRNVIGVDPRFYEFLFQIDADTVVAPDSATQMISACVHDTRIIGVCGETALTNAKSSFVTMVQVYEYYISHNLTKAFESLFGSVTCLPGCFSMYRVRDEQTGKPLFVSKEVVEAYQENRVDTLHMKNLLHLGEDRYLTTLLLKFHSKYKTKYNHRAHAWTIAPDSWSVFLSQRRRWINSTVHNLMELIPLTQLCGFCCFSMRFVVFLDLLSTIVQPVIVGYLVYLIYLIASDSSTLPVTSLILLGAIYGLQAIIFLLHRKWEMIAWMIIYILATPIFALGLPLYSFWHMDDFSWGNTRIVTGEKGKKVVVSDEGKFDPASIPTKQWEEYQKELWDSPSQNRMREKDAQSVSSDYPFGQSVRGLGSVYDGAGAYNLSDQNLMPRSAMASRPGSHIDLARASYAPSAFGLMSVAGGDMEMSSMTPVTNDQITDQLVGLFNELGDRVYDMTKRDIRTLLQLRFQTSLKPQAAFINKRIEELLLAQTPMGNRSEL